jgi:hypothetical protein
MRTWGPDRQANLRQRWKEDPERQSLAKWEEFFTWIRKSDFLMGKAATQAGRPPFQASLDWLLKPRNWGKVLDGQYHREVQKLSEAGQTTADAARRVLDRLKKGEVRSWL